MRAAPVIVFVVALATAPHTFAQQPPQPPQPAQPSAAPAAPQPPQAPQPAPAARAPQAPRPVMPAPASAPARGARPVQAAPAQPAPPGAPFVTVEPNQPGQLVNIQIDIALISEGGVQPAARKTVTLTLADKQEGSVRSMDRGSNPQGSLNVDARPVVQANGLVLTRIGLEYSGGDDVPFVQIRAQPLLESGRALRISRAVSPKTDRSVTVEVTATVLK